jgi:hypothetical protein
MYYHTLNIMTKQLIETNLTIVAGISTTNLKFIEKRVLGLVHNLKKKVNKKLGVTSLISPT